MPLGFERINARKSQPNPNINFIKPLEGDDKAIAQDFLERIAAQCVPVMREHHIYVMSLEEFPANTEFVGRNFNAGEVIQLVLRSARTGQWLPFSYVQMVMMHELAHCKQMNHSKAFWAVRNKYASEMRDLWARNYSGEGIWGRGKLLEAGEFEQNSVCTQDALPEHLCGGTYQSARRKRKRKPQLSYQEQKERRILRKFGANGIALGEDDEVKAELENGKKPRGKPRVAKSKRGRELRAAAALARFEQAKKVEEPVKEEEKDEDNDFETASEEDEDENNPTKPSIVDKEGRRLIKVCEDENPEDGDAQNEMQELNSAALIKQESSPSPSPSLPPKFIKPEIDDSVRLPIEPRIPNSTRPQSLSFSMPDPAPPNGQTVSPGSERFCPICSFQNTSDTMTCGACSHVLDLARVAHWTCKGEECKGSLYKNPDDAGVCGVCGKRRG
ncbi:WLM-domain-containing protein [Xylariaceae sp. FL0594]|nr:WLM-domain-containing protein [Xylariaceae sp. FL0594]